MTEQERLNRYFRESMGPSEGAVHIEDVDGFCYPDTPSPHLPIVVVSLNIQRHDQPDGEQQRLKAAKGSSNGD